MRAALVFTTIREDYFPHLDILFSVLAESGWSLALEESYKEQLIDRYPNLSSSASFNSAESLKSCADIVLSMGGDGTFLKTILYVRDSQIPILGINMGRLGFLANVNKERIREAFDLLKSGKYITTERSLIQMDSEEKLFAHENYALNELTIHKKESASMISIEVHVGGEYLNTYWADGLIISTPTGSTAYSLSCGGPIITPDSPVLVITPIAPHNLNVRPIIIQDDLEIKVRVDDRSNSHLLTLDSRSEVINDSYELTITKAPFRVKTVQFENFSFFDTIRDKLLWGLDRRN
jgi:NAD+ kinase